MVFAETPLVPRKKQLRRICYIAIVSILACSHTPAYSDGDLLQKYQDIAGGLPLKTVTDSSATYADGDTQWTIYGAIQSSNPDYAVPAAATTGNVAPQIHIVASAISDTHILPYSDMVKNRQDGNILHLMMTPGEYEPGSFVIRAGSSPLKDVTITATPLAREGGTEVIPNDAIDIRVVKPWFQSSIAMRWEEPRQPKQLIPELLLHDNKLVRVDYANQANIVRSGPELSDSDQLLPFDIPPNFNQQIWITVRPPFTARDGVYRGTLTLQGTIDQSTQFHESVVIQCTVLPFTLEKPQKHIGLYYLARLITYSKLIYVSRGKNSHQLEEELEDMLNHGVNILSIDHDYEKDRDFARLSQQLQIARQAGFSNEPILYLDWYLGDHQHPTAYAEKLTKLRGLLGLAPSQELWIYNKDESKLDDLLESSHTFSAAHNIGAKNVVAITADVARELPGLLDLPVLQHSTSTSSRQSLQDLGMSPLAYGIPHSAEERPSTVRWTYGLALAQHGLAGTLSYAYQTSEPWDDWKNWESSYYKPNVMAYPTSGAPIPTLQWEAWREAVDDLRYLATYMSISKKTERQALDHLNIVQTETATTNSNLNRTRLISAILELINSQNSSDTQPPTSPTGFSFR